MRPTRPEEGRRRTIGLARGPVLNALIEELAGEFPGISFWNESTEGFIRQSFLGPELRVTIHTSKAAIVVLNRTLFDEGHQNVPKIQRESEWRIHSEMVQLVSEVTGWKISLEIVD